MLTQDPSERLPALTLDGMHRRGVPSAVAFMMEHLMNHRAVHWAVDDVPPDDLQRLNDLWNNLQYVRQGEDLVAWGASLREFLWDSTDPWSTYAHHHDLMEQREQWERAKRLVGLPVLRAIKDHEHWKAIWPQAAASDYAQLVRHQQDRRALRRREYPESNVPPDELSVGLVEALAQSLKERFGLLHLTVGGALGLEDTWHHLTLAEQGLSTLARALGWNEQDIGGRRIGLSFEMDGGSASAHYDPSSRTINVALNGGWGCFAHEWGHALDHALGTTWLPSAHGLNRYATQQASGDYAHYPDAFQDDRAALRARITVPDSPAVRTQVARRTIAGLPQTLRYLRDKAPSPAWKNLADEQIDALNGWLDRAFNPSSSPTTINAQWRRWKATTEGWTRRTDAQGPALSWVADWALAVRSVETVAFEALPDQWSWQAQAKARDAHENAQYWSTPHEEWARSFHAYVRSQTNRDSWLADRTDRADHFPQGIELDREIAWWQANLPRWRSTWSQAPAPVAPRTTVPTMA